MTTLVREARHEGPVLVGAAAGSVLIGVAIANGGTFPLLLAGAVFGVTLLFVVSSLGDRAISWWPVLSVSLYPFLRFPHNNSIITFDRLWIVSLGAILFARTKPLPATRTTKAVTAAFLFYVAWYGIRAVTTGAYSDAGRLGPVGSWLDAALLPFLLYVTARRVLTTPERVRRLAASLALAGSIMAGIAIAERVAGFELATRSGGEELFDQVVRVVRVSGPYPAAEMLIIALLVCFAATLYWIQAVGPSAHMLGGIAATIQVIGLGLTLFRIAWLLIPLVLIVAFGLRPKKFTRTVMVTFTVIVAGILLFSVLERNHVFTTRLTGRVAQKNITGRLATYSQGYRLFRSEPLVGVGVNRFSKVAAEQPTPVRNGVAALGFPHNSYLGMLAEQGIVGFAVLFALTFAFWRLMRTFRHEASTKDDIVLSACVTAAALAYFVGSMTLYLVPAGPANAFLALFIGAAAARLDATASASADGA
jgi:O-antigen ligase